jgi:hypothetical protein
VPLWAKRLFLVKLRFILCEKASIETFDEEEIEGEKVGVISMFENLHYSFVLSQGFANPMVVTI